MSVGNFPPAMYPPSSVFKQPSEFDMVGMFKIGIIQSTILARIITLGYNFLLLSAEIPVLLVSTIYLSHTDHDIWNMFHE